VDGHGLALVQPRLVVVRVVPLPAGDRPLLEHQVTPVGRVGCVVLDPRIRQPEVRAGRIDQHRPRAVVDEERGRLAAAVDDVPPEAGAVGPPFDRDRLDVPAVRETVPAGERRRRRPVGPAGDARHDDAAVGGVERGYRGGAGPAESQRPNRLGEPRAEQEQPDPGEDQGRLERELQGE